MDLDALGATTLAVSAHKLGGPQGVGALAFAPGAQPALLPAGTENVAGLAAFAAAARAANRQLSRVGDQARWRDAAAARLANVGAVVAGKRAPRLPGTLCVATADFPSALQVMALDLEGVEVSAGAACSSGKVKPSGVLAAMGFGGLAAGALRASGGWTTTEQDWDRFAEVWLAARARRARSLAARTKEYA